MDNSKKLLDYAVWLLGRRSYHSAELRKKLVQKIRRLADSESDSNSGSNSESNSQAAQSGDQATIEKVITKLEEYKYINDGQYIRHYADDQILRKPQGLRLIKQKLRQKGIPADEIEQALTQDDGSGTQQELEQAKMAFNKKEKALGALPAFHKKQKLYRFLVSRGFSQEIIMKVLK